MCKLLRGRLPIQFKARSFYNANGLSNDRFFRQPQLWQIVELVKCSNNDLLLKHYHSSIPRDTKSSKDMPSYVLIDTE